jgi:hypothetical protein
MPSLCITPTGSLVFDITHLFALWILELCHNYKGINPSQLLYIMYENVFTVRVTEAALSDVQHAFCWERCAKIEYIW